MSFVTYNGSTAAASLICSIIFTKSRTHPFIFPSYIIEGTEMCSIVIKQLVDYIIIVCLTLSYIYLVNVVSQDLASNTLIKESSLQLILGPL